MSLSRPCSPRFRSPDSPADSARARRPRARAGEPDSEAGPGMSRLPPPPSARNGSQFVIKFAV
eukprot:913142-Rhodomonas_salina.2